MIRSSLNQMCCDLRSLSYSLSARATISRNPDDARHSEVGEFLILWKHEIPAVETVLASVGNDVTRKPTWALFPWVCEEKCTTPTVDAVDLRIRLKGFFGRTHNREYCGFET